MDEERVNAVADRIAGIADAWRGKFLIGKPLREYSTFRIGGPAAGIAFPEGIAELKHLLAILREEKAIAWQVIGRGSNILFADEGFDGVIIILGQRFSGIDVVEKDGVFLVRAEAGCSLARLVNTCAIHGFSGLEFASGIPGSVGGAITMNAGAWGGEMADVLAKVGFVGADGVLYEKKREELEFSYRRLRLSGNEIVLSGTFRLRRAEPERVAETGREYVRRRAARQPSASMSAGSFFKNPPGMAAGRMIEEAGLKGCKVGGAMVSTVHANFIVNTGTATARDVVELMDYVRRKVYASSGVMLEPEVRLIGF